jgi:hypothetical protein
LFTLGCAPWSASAAPHDHSDGRPKRAKSSGDRKLVTSAMYPEALSMVSTCRAKARYAPSALESQRDTFLHQVACLWVGCLIRQPFVWQGLQPDWIFDRRSDEPAWVRDWVDDCRKCAPGSLLRVKTTPLLTLTPGVPRTDRSATWPASDGQRRHRAGRYRVLCPSSPLPGWP